jgi:hypothetical protein
MGFIGDINEKNDHRKSGLGIRDLIKDVSTDDSAGGILESRTRSASRRTALST